MIHAVLIDDEKNALEVLDIQLQRHCPDIQVVAKCSSGLEGVKAIRLWEPEVVFLDIQMPFMNGFEVIKETAELNYAVIFTTAYDQFALQAFKVAAVDYLLKPFEPAELQAAVEKVRERQALATDATQKLKALMELMHPSAPPTRKIAIPTGDTIEFYGPDEIIRCSSDSNYTNFHLTNGQKLTIAKTLKEVEESLTGLSFCRVHQSHLINMHFVVRVIKGDGGYVLMKDGTQVSISRQRREAFLDSFHRL